MAIQTQRFTPLKANFHKLATTQSELDEEARRTMMINDQQNAAKANLANQAAVNKNNRFNAEMQANKKQQGLNQQQRGIDNESRDRTHTRLDANVQRLTENEDYARKQDGLDRKYTRQRNEGIDKRNEKTDMQNDYKFNRMQEDNARVDAERQEKAAFKQNALVFGTIGHLVSQANKDQNFSDDGYIDLSSEMKAVSHATKGHNWKGKAEGKIIDGKLHYYDDRKQIELAGGPARTRTDYLEESTRFSDMDRKQKLFGEVSKGNRKAQSDALSQFNVLRKQIVSYEKILSDPDVPPEAKAKIEISKNRIENEAEEWANAAEGRVDSRYNFSNYKPEKPKPDAVKTDIPKPGKVKKLGGKDKPKSGGRSWYNLDITDPEKDDGRPTIGIRDGLKYIAEQNLSLPR